MYSLNNNISMNIHLCENNTCWKTMKIKSVNCLKCNRKFCSDRCLKDHINKCQEIKYFEELSINDSLEYSIHNTNKQSIFMKNGKVLEYLELDPLYSLENFERVGNSRYIIGVGMSGKIKLVKNIVNKKLYALKQVLKN